MACFLIEMMGIKAVRRLYSFLFYLILPFVFLRLLWRGRRLPAYRERWAERLGYYPFQLQGCIWIHAVSVGETIAALPLIKALQARYPKHTFLVTTMTPTGAMRVKAALAESVIHAYLPYDLPCAMARFLKAMQPRLAILMETELWPNMLAACSQKKIPVCLLNARLSAQSANAYRRIASLAREMLQQVTVIAAQAAADAERFMQLGASASQVQLSGNLKFDLELPSDLAANAHLLHQSLSPDGRMIWIAASTHEGEEEIILKAHQHIRKHIPNALLILVPRHPDRFNAVAEQSQKIFATVRRSEHLPCTAETAVYLGDTMGELLLLYGASDAAFVGGSLIARGGHNLLEPAALAKPLLSGPHLFNFTEMRDLFLQAQALCIVYDAASLAKQLLALMQDQSLRTQMGTAARLVLEANRGALDKQLQLIAAYLPR